MKIWVETDSSVYSINHLLTKNSEIDYNAENNVRVIIENIGQEKVNLQNSVLEISALARLSKKSTLYKAAQQLAVQSLEANQRLVVFQTSMQEFLKAENWTKNKSPFIDKLLKNNSYGNAQASISVENSKIKSQQKRIDTQLKNTNNSKSNGMQLFIYSNATSYIENGKNNDTVYFAIKNLNNESIQITPFENVSILASGLNQTSMMLLRPTQATAKQQLPISIASNEHKTVFKITLNELLYTKDNQSFKKYFWQWNTDRKSPAISPIVFQDGRLTSGVSLWFEVQIGNKKSSSEILELPVIFSSKKKRS